MWNNDNETMRLRPKKKRKKRHRRDAGCLLKMDGKCYIFAAAPKSGKVVECSFQQPDYSKLEKSICEGKRIRIDYERGHPKGWQETRQERQEQQQKYAFKYF